MSTAEQIVTHLLEDDPNPADIYLSSIVRNLVVSDRPTQVDRRRVYIVHLKGAEGEQPRAIGSIYKDEHWNMGWSAYEVYSQRVRDSYAGRYYVCGDWRKTPEEAAADLLAKWKRT